MESTVLIIGIIVSVLGLGLVLAAIVSELGDSWWINRYEVWVLLGMGLVLLLVGSWLVA